MAYDTIEVRRDGMVEYVTLNRPAVRNAWNEPLIAEVTAWAEATAGAAEVRCVVFGGAGKVFSAGADVAWMAQAQSYTRDENIRDATAASRMFHAIDTLPCAVIGRVHGAALGGGCGLAAVCDVVVAEEGAVFGFTEVKLGILPAVISPFALAKIGRSAARDLFITGRRFDAAHALAIGLVHAVVPADRLDVTVQGYVDEVLSSGPQGVAAVKALIPRVWGQPAEDVRDLTATALADRRASAEAQEGFRAFFDKRAPSWKVSR